MALTSEKSGKNRPSRRLQRECERNIEVLWCVG